MLCRISDAARRYNMFPQGCTVLCGVSGGADSMAMLCALLALREALGIREVVAAHVNHGLRGAESDRDEAFVRTFAHARGIRYFCASVDVKNEARQTKEGIEQAARRLRYAFFEQAAAQAGAQRIATAHTADDNLETVLINLSRGAGLDGLSGIPPVRGSIVRPLLEVSREQVLAYLSETGVTYVEDSTNSDTAYTRNLMRHRVVPVLKSRNPSVCRAVSSMTQLLRRDGDYLDLQTRQAFDALVEDSPDGASARVCPLCALHPALSSGVCRLLYEAAGGKPGALSYQHTESLLALARSHAPSGSVCLPGGISARRMNDRLFLGKPTGAAPTFTPFPLRIDENRRIGDTNYFINARMAENNEFIHNSFNTFYINYDIICTGVFVRPRRPGDRFSLPGRGVSKSIKKLFIEAKIPLFLRECVPVLAAGDEVLAVAGFGLSEKYAASGAQQALRVSITESSPSADFADNMV